MVAGLVATAQAPKIVGFVAAESAAPQVYFNPKMVKIDIFQHLVNLGSSETPPVCKF